MRLEGSLLDKDQVEGYGTHGSSVDLLKCPFPLSDDEVDGMEDGQNNCLPQYFDICLEASLFAMDIVHGELIYPLNQHLISLPRQEIVK